jgi:hypothetical protein
MIIFRQKQYNQNPEKNPSSYGKGYESAIINSGGEGNSSSTRGNNQQVQAQQMAVQINNQQELMRQKALQEMNANQIRKSKYTGIQERANAQRNTRSAALNQAKKQASSVGIQNARELERRKNYKNTNVYKRPTEAVKPIAEDKKKD